ncbi:MAG: PIN domain-containing protein [Gemmataceae bacterium]|nr:PIN domain-containing protein [Gemmataceae bacterium]
MKTFLDAAFVLALVSTRDQHHARAKELAPQYIGKPLLTTEAVLLEIGDGLARRHKSDAVAMIDWLRTDSDVEVVRTTPELFDQAFELYRTHDDKDWGLTDCLSFVVMRQYGVTDALTHDHHFVQAGFVALMR